jgi:transcriptional regulator
MLYTPPAFREADIGRLHAHIAATGFAAVITVGAQGPIVSYIPLLLDPGIGPYGMLSGHLARANPQWKESDLTIPAVAAFMGPDAYVSPGWYPSKQEHGKAVPTWNYSIVQARGRLEVIDDPDRLAAHVAELTDKHEGRFPAPWQVTDAPADYVKQQLRAIVGIRMQIDALEGKVKLSQNRSAADQAGVVAGLKASRHEGDLGVAELMERGARVKIAP